MNQLILGDNLEVLRKMDSESVDLIYLDPPFFSNRNYEVIWGDKGEVRSFEDRFSGGIDHYIAWLKERVQEMHRILKSTGSIFLHCDWHANAHIRVSILDKIFGYSNFISEIIWKRATAHNTSSRKLGAISDTIFMYVKNERGAYKFKPPTGEHSEKYLNDFYKFSDEQGGRYRLDKIERNQALGIRPNLIYEFKGYTPEYGWMMVQEKLEAFDKLGKIVWSKNGRPQRKIYLNEVEKPKIANIWDDINSVQASSQERIGYPTQKPEKLLQRIIEMASNEGDIVLDPFVGGGTSILVAEKLERNWIGIDQSVQAIKVTELRLDNHRELFSKPFTTQLYKYDYDTLRYKDAFEFEHFMVQQFGGYTKQRGDLGIDGRTRENSPIQVKRSENIGRNVIDNFFSAIQRYDKQTFELHKREEKPIGYILAFSFGRGAIQEVGRLKNEENVIIKLVTVEEIVPISKKPSLIVTLKDLGKDAKKWHEIEFKAVGTSASGIEFYSWDFNYDDEKGIFKAEVMLDKQGTQNYKFKVGRHQIAVKVIDNDGLENIEILKLKINGAMEIE